MMTVPPPGYHTILWGKETRKAYSMLIRIAENRWLHVLRGLLAIAFGLIALTWPGLTPEALIILFGIYAVMFGSLLTYLGLKAFEYKTTQAPVRGVEAPARTAGRRPKGEY